MEERHRSNGMDVAGNHTHDVPGIQDSQKVVQNPKTDLSLAKMGSLAVVAAEILAAAAAARFAGTLLQSLLLQSIGWILLLPARAQAWLQQGSSQP